MCGLLKLLRATLLGACLCLAAAQLAHAQSAGLTQAAQWTPSCEACSTPDQAPSDSQLPGDLGSIDSAADDGDDFDDASLHPHLMLRYEGFSVCARKRAVHLESLRVRREDRRCDKPPRPQQP